MIVIWFMPRLVAHGAGEGQSPSWFQHRVWARCQVRIRHPMYGLLYGLSLLPFLIGMGETSGFWRVFWGLGLAVMLLV